MLAGSAAGAEQLLTRLRGMAPGVTWRDVLPDLPVHWVARRPETWTTPYHPFGPYDYQQLPTGPALHVQWPERGDPARLDALVAAARAAGWPVYGAGVIDTPNPAWRTMDALLVLEHATTEDGSLAFVQWLDTQPGVQLAAIPRTGTETYTA